MVVTLGDPLRCVRREHPPRFLISVCRQVVVDLKEVVVARAKSEAIDEANRNLTAAAVQLEEREQEVVQFEAEVARLKAKAAVVPNEFECPITMCLMLDPAFAADGHTCEASP